MFALNFFVVLSLIIKHIFQQMGYLNGVLAYVITTKPLFHLSSLPSTHFFLLILYLVWVVSVLITCCSLNSVLRSAC